MTSDTPNTKAKLRRQLRKARREHAAALPPQVSALVFSRPPRPVLDLIPDDAAIGLYRAAESEAPAARYARFFVEAGHAIALPRLADESPAMEFRVHTDPFAESDLESGPFGVMQPTAEAASVTPDVLFVPVLGFTSSGHRLGQGGGHYDRWLARHPETIAIGLAWDTQKVESLPLEEHDMKLAAIVTPTQVYGGG